MKVSILCPAGSISGGPEAMHQLCGGLRARGVDAAMVYYGGPSSGGRSEVPSVYAYCGAAGRPVAEDGPDQVIVIPEVTTSLAHRFPAARKVIWWLSVDNYFKWQHLNPGPSVLDPNAGLLHLCQSYYARDFLLRAGIPAPLMLTDYLTPGAFTVGPPTDRLPVIAYNPKKAPDTLRDLIATGGGRTWIPLEGLDKPALADLLREVRLYIDLGPHPGRDRLPREAALCGTVVLTGRRGAAAFAGDVPLPAAYRLDEAAPDFQANALGLIDRLLGEEDAFLLAWAEQRSYRDWISRNAVVFAAELEEFIAALGLRQRSAA
jgi:hypothetical protein